MWDKLDKRSFASAPLVVYAVYKSLGDVWNKVKKNGTRITFSYWDQVGNPLTHGPEYFECLFDSSVMHGR